MNEDINRQLLAGIGMAEEAIRKFKLALIAINRDNDEYSDKLDISYLNKESFEDFEKRTGR